MRVTNSSLLGALALVLALGCAPTNPGLVAEGVLSSDSMCMVTATNALLAEGTFDVGTSGDAYRVGGVSYSVFLKVGNQLINNSQRIYPLRADPDVIVVDHVEVTLLDSGETPLSLPGVPNPYLVSANGAIGSTTSTDPTLGIAQATIIPDSYGRLLGASFSAGGTILARMRVIGTTAGGSQLTSGPMTFSIRLCTNCLFACAVDAMGMPIPADILSCQPGQDGVSRLRCAP